jgi:hypothetical protein
MPQRRSVIAAAAAAAEEESGILAVYACPDQRIRWRSAQRARALVSAAATPMPRRSPASSANFNLTWSLGPRPAVPIEERGKSARRGAAPNPPPRPAPVRGAASRGDPSARPPPSRAVRGAERRGAADRPRIHPPARGAAPIGPAIEAHDETSWCGAALRCAVRTGGPALDPPRLDPSAHALPSRHDSLC